MSSVIGSIAGTTGLGSARQIVWAANTQLWWAFQFTSTTTLSSWSSSDGITWTPRTSFTLSAAHSSEGRDLMLTTKVINNIDTIWITYVGTPTGIFSQRAIRATVSGTIITYHTTDTTISDGSSIGSLNAPIYSSSGWEIDSLNKIHCVGGALDVNEDVSATRATDSGLIEQATPPTWTTVVGLQVMSNSVKSGFIADTASGTIVYLGDGGTNNVTCTSLVSWKFDGSTWSSITSPVNNISAINKNDWGAVKRTTSDIHLVYRDSTGSLIHWRYNGVSWFAGQSIVNQNNASGSGIALTSDGVSVWLAVIGTDAANSVRYIKWTSNDYTGNGDAWDSVWSDVETSTATRTFLGATKDVANQTALFYWTEGSNMVAATAAALAPPDPPGLANRDVVSPLGSGAASATLLITFTGTQPPKGDKIVVGFWASFSSVPTISSVKDNAAVQNTYVASASSIGSTTQGVWIFWLDLPMSATWTGNYVITVTFSASVNESDGGAIAYSNMQLGAPTDINNNTNSSAAATPGSVNPTLTPATYFVVVTDATASNPATFTWPAPFLSEVSQLNGATQQAGSVGDALNNSGAQNPSITINNSLWNAVIAAFPGAPILTAIQNISPGRTWQKRYWKGLKNPIPGAVAGVAGPVSNIVTATDALATITDVTTRTVSLPRSFSDSLAAISDTATRVVSFPRSALDNLSGTLSDSVTRLLNLPRSVVDTLSALSDAATRAALSYLRSATDNLIAPSDAATRIVSFPRSATDNLPSMSDVATAIKVIVRSAADTLSAISDIATRTAQSFTRTSTDSLTLSDIATRAAQAFLRTATDTLPSMSDTATIIKVIIRSATDTLSSLSESISRLVSLPRTGTDNLAAISDSATKIQNFSRSVADSLAALSDSAIRIVQHPRSVLDTLSPFSDSATRVVSLVRSSLDSLQSLTEIATRSAQSFLRSAIDNLPSLSDIATNGGSITQVLMSLVGSVRNGSLILKIRDGTLRGRTRDGSLISKVRDSTLRIFERDASSKNKTRG
jgi:hypothetical protein